MFYLCEICLFFTLINVQSCATRGVCSRIESLTSNDKTLYYTKQFCCDNYQGTPDQGCYGCDIGLTSKRGSACTPCPEHTYGFRCVEKCECNKDQRCDNKVGCVSKVDDKENMVNSGYTIAAIDPATANELSTEYFPTSSTLKTTMENKRFDNTTNFERLSENQIIGYSIGGTTLIFLGCGIFFSFMYTRRCFSKKSNSRKTMSPVITITAAENDKTDQVIILEGNIQIQTESVYDEIDEQTLCDEPRVINIQEQRLFLNTSGSAVKLTSSKSLDNIHMSCLTMKLHDRSHSTESLVMQIQDKRSSRTLEAIQMADTEWLNDLDNRLCQDNKSADSLRNTSETREICGGENLKPYQSLNFGKSTVYMNADQIGQYSKLCQKYLEIEGEKSSGCEQDTPSAYLEMIGLRTAADVQAEDCLPGDCFKQ